MPTFAASDSSSLSRKRERVRVRARALRQGQTDAESLLWSKLRDRQILHLKFRRQRPIGPYFADFACLDVGLVIELDGGQHVGSAFDIKRESEMAALGFQTLRFWNNDVLTQINGVLEKIFQTAETLTLTLSRLREREHDVSLSRLREREQDVSLSRLREREQDVSLSAVRSSEQDESAPVSVPSPVPGRGLG